MPGTRWGGTLYGEPDGDDAPRDRASLRPAEPELLFRCPICSWGAQGCGEDVRLAAYQHAADHHPEMLRGRPGSPKPAPRSAPQQIQNPLMPHVQSFLSLLGLACTDPKAAAVEAGKMLAGGLDPHTGGMATKAVTMLRRNKDGVYE